MLAVIEIQCGNILFTSKFGEIDVFVIFSIIRKLQDNVLCPQVSIKRRSGGIFNSVSNQPLFDFISHLRHSTS